MFDCPEKETTVPNFKFVSKLTEFSSCQVCKKHLYDLSAISTKYPQYGTLQRMAECSHEASIKLCILHKDKAYPFQNWNFETIETKFFDTTQHQRGYWGCNHESRDKYYL